jgi:hypothetical protein
MKNPLQLLRLAACALISLVTLVACKQLPERKPPELWVTGYTCCNLRHYRETNQISDGNYTDGVVIPAGSSIRIYKPGFRSYRADAEISGNRYVLTQDYGRSVESFEAWITRIVVPENPKRKFAKWPAKVLATVQSGQIMQGMTKEQVLVALGYPLKTATPSLDNNPWRYWHTTFNKYDVDWRGGVVSKIANANEKSEVLAPGEVKN